VTYKVSFRPEAEADLFALYKYIAGEAGHKRAGDYIGRIEAACMSLATFPMRGAPRKDLGPEMRALSFEGRALILYRVEGNLVRIARMFYAGRDYEALFKSGDNKK
jgi:toxin ParE1/3/4